MRERMRRNDRSDGRIGEPEEVKEGSQNLSEIREEGESLLQAAEEAIKSALSGDSQSFLAQSCQQGGQ